MAPKTRGGLSKKVSKKGATSKASRNVTTKDATSKALERASRASKKIVRCGMNLDTNNEFESGNVPSAPQNVEESTADEGGALNSNNVSVSESSEPANDTTPPTNVEEYAVDEGGESVPGQSDPANDTTPPIDVDGSNAAECAERDSINEPEEVSHGLPLKPEFFFEPAVFNAYCKIQTRCNLHTFMTIIKGKEFEVEKDWFESHPQFQHLFHMDLEPNHKLQGLWMLMLRTACLDKAAMKQNSVVWFVVNGVPIRYSLREHALLCGFNCHRYPTSLKPDSSLIGYTSKLRQKLFPKEKIVNVGRVKAKLISMKKGTKRSLQLSILYFLSAVIAQAPKGDGNIDFFLWKMAENPNACRDYPWGRMTYLNIVEAIYSKLDKLKGKGKGTPKQRMNLPGFVIPLEILPFECIPNLKNAHRVVVDEINRECPLMCNMKFGGCDMKGWRVDQVLETVGDSNNFDSILKTEYDEQEGLLRRVLGDWFPDRGLDLIQDNWDDYLAANESLCWKDLYDADVASRVTAPVQEEDHEQEEPRMDLSPDLLKDLLDRLKRLEGEVKDLRGEVRVLRREVRGEDCCLYNDSVQHGDKDGKNDEDERRRDDAEDESGKNLETEPRKEGENEAHKEKDVDESTEKIVDADTNFNHEEASENDEEDREDDVDGEDGKAREGEGEGEENMEKTVKKQRTPWLAGRLRPRNDVDAEAAVGDAKAVAEKRKRESAIDGDKNMDNQKKPKN